MFEKNKNKQKGPGLAHFVLKKTYHRDCLVFTLDLEHGGRGFRLQRDGHEQHPGRDERNIDQYLPETNWTSGEWVDSLVSQKGTAVITMTSTLTLDIVNGMNDCQQYFSQ